MSRWRKLEGSDPSAYEMIQKVQTLQKRLIAKTEEVVEADLLIQEKEKLYVELKNILARQPGPEVAEQLSIYQVLCSSRCVLIGLLYKPHPNGCQHRLETLLRLTPYPIGSCVLPPCPCIFDCALAVDGAFACVFASYLAFACTLALA